MTSRILHVDDDATFLTLTAALLTRAGHFVESASGGQDAWDRLVSDFGRFDMVITDLQMPGFDGWWLVQLLRERDYPGRIIVYSGALNRDTSAKFLALGVDAVIGKDSSPRELLNAVNDLLRNAVTETAHSRSR